MNTDMVQRLFKFCITDNFVMTGYLYELYINPFDVYH